jgi:hypothetical protein
MQRPYSLAFLSGITASLMSTDENLPAFFEKPTRSSLLTLLSHSRLSSLQAWCSQSSVNPCGPRNTKTSFSTPLFANFWAKYKSYSSLPDHVLRETHNTEPVSSPPCTHNGLVFSRLASEFPAPFLQRLLHVRHFSRDTSDRTNRANLMSEKLSSQLLIDNEIMVNWPQPISAPEALTYCQAYMDAITITPRKPCVSCGRAFFTNELHSSYTFGFCEESPSFCVSAHCGLSVCIFLITLCHPLLSSLVPLRWYLSHHQLMVVRT